MQTFLPEYTFEESARVLDNKRLNKQLLEGRQILQVLLEPDPYSNAWHNHPAILMWKNYEHYLYSYLTEIAKECLRRNISIKKNWEVITILRSDYLDNTLAKYPFWMTDKDLFTKVVISHRHNLYHKDIVKYQQYRIYGYNTILVCCPNCKYFWPTHLTHYKQLF